MKLTEILKAVTLYSIGFCFYFFLVKNIINGITTNFYAWLPILVISTLVALNGAYIGTSLFDKLVSFFSCFIVIFFALAMISGWRGFNFKYESSHDAEEEYESIRCYGGNICE